MATSVLPGFRYVKGPREMFRSTISSTATFQDGCPLTYSDDRTLIEADSDSTAVIGIATHDAADTIYSGSALVMKANPETIFSVKVATNLASSVLSAGQAAGLSKSGNNFLVAPSGTTKHVVIVPRDDGTTIDSADSSVWVSFLGNAVGVFPSNASVNIFAQN